MTTESKGRFSLGLACGTGDYGESGPRFLPCATQYDDRQANSGAADANVTDTNSDVTPLQSGSKGSLFDPNMQDRKDEIDALRSRVDVILNKMVQNSGNDVNKLRQKIAEMRAAPQQKPQTPSTAVTTRSWNATNMLGCPLSPMTAVTNATAASATPSADTELHDNLAPTSKKKSDPAEGPLPETEQEHDGEDDDDREDDRDDEEDDEEEEDDNMDAFDFNVAPLSFTKSIQLGDVASLGEIRKSCKAGKDPPASLKASESFLHLPDPGGDESYCSGESSQSPPPESLLLERAALKADSVIGKEKSPRKIKPAPTPEGDEGSRAKSRTQAERPRPEQLQHQPQLGGPKPKVPDVVRTIPMKPVNKSSSSHHQEADSTTTRDPPETPKTNQRYSEGVRKITSPPPPVANIDIPHNRNHHSRKPSHSSSSGSGSYSETPGQSASPSPLGDVTVVEEVTELRIRDPYGDKGIYTGVLVKRRPHGRGTMKYDDGRHYEGFWNHGRWHGVGRAIFANGDIFEGTYDMDQRHGHGMYQWSDGRVYTGQFFQDQRQGRGTYTWPDGAVYQGEFRAGHREGQGMYRFADGSVYTGEWKQGKYNGVGECRWSDGRSYRGEWQNGRAW